MLIMIYITHSGVTWTRFDSHSMQIILTSPCRCWCCWCWCCWWRRHPNERNLAIVCVSCNELINSICVICPPLPGNLNLVASAHRLLCLSMSSSPLPPPCPNNYDRRLSHDQFALHQLSVCVCFNLISKHTHTRILYKLFAQSIEHTKPEQIKLKQLAAASCLPVLLCQFVALFGAI